MANTINASSYGATGNGTTDDTAALQAAINAAQAGNFRLELDPGRFKTSAPLIVRQGQSAPGAVAYSFDMDGFGASILPTHAGDTISIQPQSPVSSNPTDRSRFPVSIRNLVIDGALSSVATNGIRVGRAGYSMYMFARAALLENVTTVELRGTGLIIENAAHFDVNRFTQRTHNGGKGLYMVSLENTFTGDISFNDCQFQGTNAGRPIHLITYTPSGQAQVRGVRFNSCVVYGSGTQVEASLNGITADIWFNSCAWDGPAAPAGEGAVRVISSNAGQVDKVWFDKTYMINYTGVGIYLQSDNPGVLRAIKITDGSFAYVAEPIKLINAEEVVIEGNTFDTCSTWALINVSASSSNLRIAGNSESQNAASHLVAIGDGSTRFQVIDNLAFSVTGAVVNDYAGSVSKQVTNNIRL